MNDDPGNLADVELARRTRAGSIACFEELVHRYETPIYRFLRSRTRNDHDAEDLAQTVFVTAFRKITRYDDAYPFRAWIFTIARRLAISHYRKTRPEIEMTPGDEPVEYDDPAKAAAARDEVEHIWELARSTLPDVQFTALWLRYEENMPITEIARITGKTRTNVKVLLHRGRRTLAEALAAGSDPRFARAREASGRRAVGHVDTSFSCQEGAP